MLTTFVHKWVFDKQWNSIVDIVVISPIFIAALTHCVSSWGSHGTDPTVYFSFRSNLSKLVKVWHYTGHDDFSFQRKYVTQVVIITFYLWLGIQCWGRKDFPSLWICTRKFSAILQPQRKLRSKVKLRNWKVEVWGKN